MSNCGYTTSNYKDKGDYYDNTNDSDLTSIFPHVEFYRDQIDTQESGHNRTIDLSNNFNTTNYMVFPVVYNGYDGTNSGIYGGGFDHFITIHNITTTTFDYAITKSNGKHTRIYVVFMVVYNTKLDFEKSYTVDFNTPPPQP